MLDDIDGLKESVCREIDLLREEMKGVARSIYGTPEVGFQEHQSSRTLVEFLRRHGFRVVQPVADMATAFRAGFAGTSPGPTIAILAEYDALPGMGHACAHNLIGAAAAGAAIGVSRIMRDLAGEVVVLGCPAEEACVDGAGGKIRLIEAGCFSGVSAALIFHPMPLTAVGGETSSLVALEFEFKGKAAHAAGNPWDGINALDGVLLAFNAINALRQHIREGVRIHGIVTHGGEAPNIVPEYAAARFFIRSQSTECLKETLGKVMNCAKGAALAVGAELSVKTVNNLYEGVRTNTTLAALFSQNLGRLGLRVEGKKKGKGSTDFGNVSRVVPSCDLSIRLGDGIVPHSREFLEAANSDSGYGVMVQGAKVMAMSTVDLLSCPELLKKAASEFCAGRS